MFSIGVQAHSIILQPKGQRILMWSLEWNNKNKTTVQELFKCPKKKKIATEAFNNLQLYSLHDKNGKQSDHRQISEHV
jgi:hypothetical protein